MLRVIDDGPGFSPGFLDGAFERFARSDTGRSTHGSGLGLSIAASLARTPPRRTPPTETLGGADVWLTVPAPDTSPETVVSRASGKTASLSTPVARITDDGPGCIHHQVI